MHILITVLVCFFAGMGAGLGTGFAGMSAAAVISPMLITFLGMDPYLAVGIALSSDVLASAVSAYTYGKNKNLDIRNGLTMMASVLTFTVVGSYIASIVPSATMGSFSVVMTFLLGVKFIVRPVMTTKEAMQSVSAKKRAVQSVVCGVIVGFICGFVGAGGGLHQLGPQGLYLVGHIGGGGGQAPPPPPMSGPPANPGGRSGRSCSSKRRFGRAAGRCRAGRCAAGACSDYYVASVPP